MKLNKILSSALVVVMIFATLVSVFSTVIFAEEPDSGNGTVVDVSKLPTEPLVTEDVKAIVDSIYNYNFATAQELLDYEISLNYLVNAVSSDGEYSLYVNYYTGFMYYKNNITGQILTSNPIDVGYKTASSDLLGQIELTYLRKNSDESEKPLYSIDWIAQGAFLEVKEIEGKGISVTYTLGDVSEFFVAPGVLLAETYKEQICQPIFDNYAALLEQHCGATIDPAIAKEASVRYNLNTYHVDEYSEIYSKYSEGDFNPTQVKSVIDALAKYAELYLGKTSDGYKKISEFAMAIGQLFTDRGYKPLNSNTASPEALEGYSKEIGVLAEGKAVYRLDGKDSVDTLRAVDKAISVGTNKQYTKEHANQHEADCKYVAPPVSTPFVKVEVNYILDEEGILTIDIPTDTESLVFDHNYFDITSITPLKHFGAGNMDNDGYIFYPDGSGTVVEFSDFYYGSDSEKTNVSISYSAPVYGNDYVYTTITGKPHAQVTMPVFGLVNDTNDGVRNGFFTIFEKGASTASLCFTSGGGTSKYASAYSVIKPYPYDKIDLSQTVSVGGQSFYQVSAERGYEGSYVYRVNMLTDENDPVFSSADANKYYPSDYAGMAMCYRDYLENTDQIEPLSEFSKDLPLYIEALGSMDIVKRFLTFPVTVSTSLTSFEDVVKIYNDLSDVTAAKNRFVDKAREYRNKAEDIRRNNVILDDDDLYLIGIYEDKAAHYDKLVEDVQNIRNINFRLTGFANGGMYFTYPAKVDFESSVGGDDGFEDLLKVSKTVSSKADYNFGIYPDFDFLFINNTAAFDGVSNSSAARMVNNRYASKQSYNSVIQGYESIFALIISTDSLGELYEDFKDDYTEFDVNTLSVSTLGSTLNSNFDEDNLINRETALGHVTSLLDQMANSDGYSLMTDAGNIYSVKYVDHILNASTDSSHFRYSSFTVPFYGMVLHGYVNYTGEPLNYSGSPDYDILRSIENGASLYYILCYDNTNYLKSDELLSQYYGIDYANWSESILEDYVTIKNAIGDLQNHFIVDHNSLIAERVIDSDEKYSNYERLANEFTGKIFGAIEDKLNLAAASNTDNTGDYNLVVDRDSVIAVLDNILSSYDDNEEGKNKIREESVARIDEILAEFESYSDGITVNFGGDDISTSSRYSYVTDSVANDKDGYKRTDFTCDNGSVVMVVYEKGDDRVVFILNYNTFAVEVTVDNTIDASLADGEKKVYTLGAYGCYKLTGDAATTIKIK